MATRLQLLPRAMSGFVMLLQLESVVMPMVCVNTGVIGTMLAELTLPFTGPGMTGPAPHWILQQASWPYLPTPQGRAQPTLGKDGPTPHHRSAPYPGSTLELTQWSGTQVDQP